MKLEKILYGIVLAGVFLALFVPVIVTQSLYFPYITGKAFFFRIIVEIIFAAWLILVLKNPIYRPRFSPILKTFILFVVVIAISDLFSPNVFKSFWSNFERMEGWITLIHLFAYFLVVGSTLASEKIWRRFFDFSIGVSLIVGGYGILQLFGVFTINQGGVRLDSTFGNAAYLAAYALFHIGLAVFQWFRIRVGAWWRHYLYGLAVLINLIIVYFTATRGAFIGLLVGFLTTLVIIIIGEKHNIKLRKVSIILLSCVLIFSIALFLFKDSSFIRANTPLNRLASISLDDASIRFQIWRIAWQGFKERPILGWGQESFNYVFNKYYEPTLYQQEPWFDRAHNIIFDWLVAGGIFGLAAYLLFFFSGLAAVWQLPWQWRFPRSDKFRLFLMRFLPTRKADFSWREKAVLTGIFTSYFIQNLFVFDNLGTYLIFIAILAYLHAQVSRPLADKWDFKLNISEEVINRLIIPLIIVVVIGVAYFVNFRGFLTSRAIVGAFQNYPNEGFAKNLDFFKKAISYGHFGVSEAREQLATAASRVIASNRVDISLKQSFYDAARSELLKQLEETPADARYFVFLGSLMTQAGSLENARFYLQEAISLSPKKQLIYFELGNNYFVDGKIAEALRFFKTAYELDPSYEEARKLYGLSAIYSRDYQLAEKILTPVFGSIYLPEDRFISVFDKVGDKKAVLKIWQERVSSTPDNPEWRVSLAAAYLGVGQRENAIKELEEAINLKPDFKEQGEYYIKEIKAGRTP
jgi:O-antigen ligase/Flp pilus assembly protein TadD